MPSDNHALRVSKRAAADDISTASQDLETGTHDNDTDTGEPESSQH